MSDKKQDLESYNHRCGKLLQDENIRFAGIIDESGNLISGGFKEGLTPLEDNEVRLKSFMEFISKITIRTDYDLSLGPINYLAARRDKVVLISFPFPISSILLLVSANPSVDIEQLARKVVDVFAGIS